MLQDTNNSIHSSNKEDVLYTNLRKKVLAICVYQTGYQTSIES